MKLPKLPVNVSDVIKENKDFALERSKPVHIEIFVDPTAPADLIEAAKAGFVPQTPVGKLHVELLDSEKMPVIGPSTDFAIILAGERKGAVDLVMQARERGDVRAVVLATVATPDEKLVSSLDGLPVNDLIIGADGVAAMGQLATLLAKSGNDKRLALAANFTMFRLEVAKELIQAASFQNAVVGALPIIPGADMPVMTITQIRMLLQMAAAFNKPMDTGRLVESGVVILGAFMFRAGAHALLDFVPVMGWAIKGGVGYSGTLAIGKAALEYFEHDLDLYDMAQDIIARRKGTQAPLALEQAKAAASDKPLEVSSSHVFRPAAFGTKRVREASSEMGAE